MTSWTPQRSRNHPTTDAVHSLGPSSPTTTALRPEFTAPPSSRKDDRPNQTPATFNQYLWSQKSTSGRSWRGGSNTAIDYVEQRQGEGHLDADNQSPLDLQVEARPLSDTWKPRPPCSTLPNSRSSRRRGYDADGRPQTRTDPQSQWARIPFSIPVGHTGFSSKQFASDLDPGASSLSPPPIQVRYPPSP